ncbi:hypothetical protein NG895_24975 [Aeoliella sp. ICT_H6.2]|uniref:Uncharacterized protein n=1 Tax=Aeoliella straminimaris TaxID=2954799 RepID=A0A9X2FDV4_9BACT|nr:hypothetical protein [Aeoliella straminimaris]MCO6047165.1 hypothetical protein [Aeoliella straminimaris]
MAYTTCMFSECLAPASCLRAAVRQQAAPGPLFEHGGRDQNMMEECD